MTPAKRDEIAKLEYAFAASLPKAEAKEAVAGMLGLTEDMAWALIVRGKSLAREAERAA
jgi:hypothetical protein